MNSKEALENIKHAPGFMGGNSRYKSVLESRIPFLEDIEIIKQDLDKLEKLEKENQELLVNKNVAQGIATKFKEENNKFKKAIEILKDKFELFIFEVDNIRYIENEYAVGQLSQEDYKVLNDVIEEKIILKEILGNE